MTRWGQVTLGDLIDRTARYKPFGFVVTGILLLAASRSGRQSARR